MWALLSHLLPMIGSDLGTRVVAIAVLVAAAGIGGFLVGKAGSAASPRNGSPPITDSHPAGPIVARWLGGQLSAAQVRERVLAQKSSAGLQVLDPSRGRSFADAVVRSAILATEARRLGLERDPKVEAAATEALSKRLIEVEFEDASKHAPIAAADLRAYYDAHPDDFLRPERLRLSDLVMAQRAPLELLRKQLQKIVGPEAEAAFATRVKALSTDAATASVGGALGSLSREQLTARLGRSATEKAWLMVRLGELSEVLEADGGFHLLRLAGREGARDVPIEEARTQIESRLWYERRDAELNKFVDGLGKKLGLVVDDEALKNVLSELR